MITTEHRFTRGDLFGVLYGVLYATGLHVTLAPTHIMAGAKGMDGKVVPEGTITGAHATLPNGYTISFQWHPGAYSNVGRDQNTAGDEPKIEVLAWDLEGNYVYEAHGENVTWGSIVRVVQYVRRVAALPPCASEEPEEAAS